MNILLTGWTFKRRLYFAIGISLMIQSALTAQWTNFALGIYIASMGLFAFGCASGNCIGGSCSTPRYSKTQNPSCK